MATLSFKVSDEESRTIRAGARKAKLSVSEFLRRRAGAAPAAPAKLERKRCPLTGAIIFAPASELPPLTVEATREMLADFP
ncbi:MAG TPA: hypothetical protein VIS74_08245 [Chthoniobacterales bacterium]